ncbi:MAG: RodZ domain-containing protein [Methylophilaceae bacterium]
MVEELNANFEAASAPSAKLGVLLQAAREEKKLSLEDVSNRLRLSLRQIKALESDDFAILPEATITRGFIRNYARLLEINPEPLLDIYRVYAPSEVSHSITLQSANILISSTRKPVWIKYIVGSILIALALGAWVVYMDYFHHMEAEQPVAVSSEDSAQLPPDDSSVSNEPMPEVALPFAEREAAADTASDPIVIQQSAPPVEPVVEKPTVPAIAPVVPTPAVPAGASPITSPSATTSPNTSVNTVVQPVASTKPVMKIRLTVNDTTWVSVIDQANNEIVNRTIPAGGVQRVEAAPPIKVVIGNAEGAQLTVNDKPFDLSPYNKLNVVRLTLE